jgi:PAS domain S-box-containing protein
MSTLLEAESRYRAVFDAARDAMIVYTRNGVVVEANTAACNMYGYAREELIGINAREAIHPDARPHFEEFLRVAGGGGEFHCETVDRRRDGTVFPIEVTGTHFTYGGQTHLMSVVRDITGHRRAEEQLRRNHDTFYNLIQNNPFGVYVVDADFRLREVSLGSQKVFRHVRPLLGRDFSEVLRTVWAEPFASEAIARFRHTLDTGEPYTAMRTVERRQDVPEVEAYDWRIERVTLPDGRFGVVCYFYDLTERQQLETALRESEARRGAALAIANLGTFEWDVRTNAVTLDGRSREIFGFAPGEGTRAEEIFARIIPADFARVSAEAQSSQRDLSRLETEYRINLPDGTVRTVVSINDAIAGPDGKAERMFGVFGDITARKQSEEALRRGEAQFRQLADAMPQMVWVTRPDGYHEYFNRRWYEFTGVPEGSTDGEAWSGMFHSEDQGRAWATWRRSLATGEPYEVEYRLRHRSGEYRWALGRALPVRNERGEIERWFGTCTDIDSLKRLTAEREDLLAREQTARAEAEAANRAKDKFLAVLSHELRTPLSPVAMTIPSLEIDPGMPLQFREDLAMVRRNIDLEVKLIDDLLDLSRVTSGKLRLQMQPLRVHELLAHVVRSSTAEAAGKPLRVRHELHAKNDLSSGDPARLQQVFWNLLRNAVKFTPEGGDITVRTWNREADGRLMVEVRDSGVGISPEVLPRVFDAFEQGEVRMTRQFGGLGLGLAIAKAVVEMHAGSIRAASDGPGRGATFTVELGVVREGDAMEPHPAAAPSAGTRRSRSRVLLVEDHPDTSRAMASLLSRSGYEVKSAHSVASALQLAGAEAFDIVVSDIGLPDATGYELMELIQERHGIKGIALSGYGMEEDVRKSREAGFAEHVTKPVNVAQLQTVIERVLGDQRPS